MLLYHDHLPIQIQRIGERNEYIVPEEESTRGTFYVSREALQQVRRSGPAWKYYNAALIEEVLEDPCALFAGLKRKEFSDGQCYVGRPARRFITKTEVEPFPDDRLFLVFVKRLYGMAVFDWEFRVSSHGNSNVPANHGDDFKELIWKKN